MTDPLSNPHDKFFRAYFGRPDVARDFVHHYLPSEVVALLDVDSLEIRKDSFIDVSLSEHFSDLLYQVDLQSGRPAYLYLLLDHKSYVDRMVAYQLLDYIKQIWDMSLKEQQEARKKQPLGHKTPLWLPPVMPLVVYHGPDEWTVNPEFIDLFEELPEPLRPYIPNFRYRIWDLSDYPSEAIIGGVVLRVVLLLLKYSHDEQLKERLPEILGLLRELADKRTVAGHLRTILRYLSGGQRQFSREELRDMVNAIFEGGPRLKTFFERELEEAHLKGVEEGRQEGEQIGLTKGRQEGRQEGLQAGQRQTQIKNIKQLLAIRFEVEREVYDEALTQLALPELEELLRVGLVVEDITEFETVLADLISDEPVDSDDVPDSQS